MSREPGIWAGRRRSRGRWGRRTSSARREARVTVRGVLHVHSAPPALSPHVEWAAAGVLGVPVSMPWVGQPAAPGMVRAELDWQGQPGMAGEITSALAGWNRLRVEVTEDASPGCDAVRFSYTPALGVFSAVPMAEELSRLLGEPWDCELESFRCAGDGAPVRWLNATG